MMDKREEIYKKEGGRERELGQQRKKEGEENKKEHAEKYVESLVILPCFDSTSIISQNQMHDINSICRRSMTV